MLGNLRAILVFFYNRILGFLKIQSGTAVPDVFLLSFVASSLGCV